MTLAVMGRSGAQRLAASMESSPLSGRGVGHASGAQRLAASMESSPSHLTILTLAVCAQRLAASMESSRDAHGVTRLVDCAQRLAASMESSLGDSVCHGVEPIVCSTPCGINGILTPRIAHAWSVRSLVLNALRHQWNPHYGTHSVAIDRFGAQRLAASMESSPSASECPSCSAAVLNALRHQWNPHVSVDVAHSTG